MNVIEKRNHLSSAPRKIFYVSWAAIMIAITISCRSPEVLSGQKTFRAGSFSPLLEVMNDRSEDAKHKLMILSTGQQALLARVRLMRVAQESIDIQTFAWEDDLVGKLFLSELEKASRRGVKIRILVDALYGLRNFKLVNSFLNANPGILIKYYNPTAERMDPGVLRTLFHGIVNFRQMNQRMHNKVMIFDQQATIIGGRNIADSYFGLSPTRNFRDRDILMIGKETRRVNESFEKFWNYRFAIPSFKLKEFSSSKIMRSAKEHGYRLDLTTENLFSDIHAAALDVGIVSDQIVSKLIESDDVEFWADLPGKNNTRGLSGGGHLTTKFQQTLEQAQQSVIVQSPYVVLSENAKIVFEALAIKGVPVWISTNSLAATDNWLAYSASFKNRRWNIESGKLNVFELKPFPGHLREVMPNYDRVRAYYRRANKSIQSSSLEQKHHRNFGKLDLKRDPYLCIHSKSLVVDGKLAVIGSYNLDPRSGNLNTEVAVFTKTPQVVEQLQQEILIDIQPRNSWAIWKKRPFRSLQQISKTFGSLFKKIPFDLWVLYSTSSFDTDKDQPMQILGTEGFYRNYTDRGLFPMLSPLHPKEIMTKLMNVVVTPMMPIL